MAGHSQWKNIKHRKARVDAKRGKEWSKCSRAIIAAARQGGADPDSNLSLRYAIDDAKAVNMPKATIENAIKKGTGELTGDDYEAVTYEGYGPGGVAFFVEALTDNRNRTAGELRSAFDKAGGNLGTGGSVAYMFRAQGVIDIKKAAVSEDRLMEVALEAGAEDVADAEDTWRVTTAPTAFRAVRQALSEAGIEPEEAELTMEPSNTVAVAGDTARKVLQLVDTLEDNDDVQKVHANFDIPESELAAIEA